MTNILALTEQQQRIAALVAEGLLNKQIAHRLGITEGTVKAHVSSAIDRLHLENRVQLAVWFVRQDMETEVVKPWDECTVDEQCERLGITSEGNGSISV